MYNIRNEKGILIAKVSNKVGKTIIMESKGNFDNKKRFHLENDMTFTPIIDYYNPYYTKLYLWAGYYLYEE